MFKKLLLVIINVFLILVVIGNYKEYQQLNFRAEEYLKEKDKINKEIFLLKEIAINLEKFRLFFEPIYLEEIKKLTIKSEILKNDTYAMLINNLDYLTVKPKKNDLTVFSNFRMFLAEKERELKNKLNDLEINYRKLRDKRKERIYWQNIIITCGLIALFFLMNIFFPFKKKKEKIFNNYFSLLELFKIVKEKSDKYLEKITDWENKIKEFKKSWENFDTSQSLEEIDSYRKNFTYCLLNLQLGLLQKDHLLINKYFTNFQQMKEKILNLLIQNKSQHLNNYLKENEEIINIFKEDLINLKKIIGEIKNYEIKK